ncbi:SOS response-associated peptidase [Labrys wisconsinensis]|uniref:Abasic site processing protein n=1 Tax=Labrys wisconsinensis TaxID=425677 RepID=A0ABU0J8I5_9HYPH|nr:SOS response-associated peptidase [Labrys wisconsinensis]MDQ0470589.1 putative SOS response-associated peptidase YedK [Labrys wisconsinensis]
MCGRFALTQTPEHVRAWFAYRDQPNFPPRYNIAPTQPVAVVTLDQGERRFVLMRWGFIPGFVKDPKEYPLVINVRSETAREKASFRAAFLRRRCLMPADGFYEWQAAGRVKRPFLIRRPDRAVFAFAAIHETWSSPDGSEIDTVAIMTTHANGTLAAVHERSPVMLLSQEAVARWLDPALPLDEAEAMLRPPAEAALELIPVGTGVNSVANDDPSLQQRVEAAPLPPEKSRKADDGQGSLF